MINSINKKLKEIAKNLRKFGIAAGLAGTMTGCYTYVPEQAIVAPAPAVVAPATVVTPVVAPAPVMVPARPIFWGPRFHHHFHRVRY